MERPTGVTILAVLSFIGAVFTALGGLALMLGMGAAGAAMRQSGEAAGGLGALLLGLGAIAGVLFLILAVVYGAIGYGLWTLRSWARIVTLVFMILGAALAALGLLASLVAFELVSLFFQLIIVGIYAWIIWYLFQPHVKEAFGAR